MFIVKGLLLNIEEIGSERGLKVGERLAVLLKG